MPLLNNKINMTNIVYLYSTIYKRLLSVKSRPLYRSEPDETGSVLLSIRSTCSSASIKTSVLMFLLVSDLDGLNKTSKKEEPRSKLTTIGQW